MSLGNLTKTTRSPGNISLVAIFIIAAVAVYKWTITPHVDYLAAAQRYEETMDNITKKNEFIETNIKVQQKKFENLQKNFVQLNSKLFTHTKATEFFSGIQVIAEDVDCEISSLNFSSENSRRCSKRYSVYTEHATLDIIGTYKNITKLITRLQNHSERVKIDTISIRSSRGNPGKLKCEAAIVIYIIQNKEDASNG